MLRYCIVGGVAGGATAAARLRRLDEKAEIILIERGTYVSYANCGLPYYLGSVITDRKRLFVQTPQGFKNRYNIDVRTGSEVLRINRKNKNIEVKDIANGTTYQVSYDTLILSPGAEPLKPPIPGINECGIFTLRNISDTDEIKIFLDEQKPASAIIVGGGFIGLEMAENLTLLGIDVTIVEMADQVMINLDSEMAAEIHHELKDHGIELILKDAVSSFEKKADSIHVQLVSGRKITTSMVILSIGVRPDAKLAKEAGLIIGERGGIVVNEYLQTSDPSIYAVGDAIEFQNPIIEKKTITYLAGPANKQGRIAADNIVSGNTKKYSGSISTAAVKIFNLTVASTGVSEKILRANSTAYLASITHSAAHATYYPGAMEMSMKILFSPSDGTLLGAQIVGYDGVDKRIDVLASIIGKRGTVGDLTEFDHAYAPPYSSAKDPVNIAGFTAENILKKITNVIQWYDIQNLDASQTVLLDVRTTGEFNAGTIKGSVNIPVDTLRSNLSAIPKNKRIVVFCAVGLRGHIASRILRQSGYDDVVNLSGGYKTWSMATRSNDLAGSCC